MLWSPTLAFNFTDTACVPPVAGNGQNATKYSSSLSLRVRATRGPEMVESAISTPRAFSFKNGDGEGTPSGDRTVWSWQWNQTLIIRGPVSSFKTLTLGVDHSGGSSRGRIGSDEHDDACLPHPLAAADDVVLRCADETDETVVAANLTKPSAEFELATLAGTINPTERTQHDIRICDSSLNIKEEVDQVVVPHFNVLPGSNGGQGKAEISSGESGGNHDLSDKSRRRKISFWSPRRGNDRSRGVDRDRSDLEGTTKHGCNVDFSEDREDEKSKGSLGQSTSPIRGFRVSRNIRERAVSILRPGKARQALVGVSAPASVKESFDGRVVTVGDEPVVVDNGVMRTVVGEQAESSSEHHDGVASSSIDSSSDSGKQQQIALNDSSDVAGVLMEHAEIAGDALNGDKLGKPPAVSRASWSARRPQWSHMTRRQKRKEEAHKTFGGKSFEASQANDDGTSSTDSSASPSASRLDESSSWEASREQTSEMAGGTEKSDMHSQSFWRQGRNNYLRKGSGTSPRIALNRATNLGRKECARDADVSFQAKDDRIRPTASTPSPFLPESEKFIPRRGMLRQRAQFEELLAAPDVLLLEIWDVSGEVSLRLQSANSVARPDENATANYPAPDYDYHLGTKTFFRHGRGEHSNPLPNPGDGFPDEPRLEGETQLASETSGNVRSAPEDAQPNTVGADVGGPDSAPTQELVDVDERVFSMPSESLTISTSTARRRVVSSPFAKRRRGAATLPILTSA